MLPRKIRITCLVTLLLGATVALAQTEFSAEVVNTDKSETTSQAKMYFAKDKIRIEPTKKDPRGGGSVIMNMATQTTTVLMDQQHMYMEVPAQTANQRSGYNFFRTGDVENACSD